MSDATTYAKVFRAAARGCMTPFGMGQLLGTSGTQQQQSGYSVGPSFSSESYDRARLTQGVFSAIADVFGKIAEAEQAIEQTGPTLNRPRPSDKGYQS